MNNATTPSVPPIDPQESNQSPFAQAVARDKARAEQGRVHEEESWRALFHSYAETINAPPLEFAINGFLQAEGVTFVGGPSGHGKTWTMLSMSKSLLEATPLFGHDGFTVERPSDRVLYFIPECGLGPFVHRLKLFRLTDFVRDGKLFCRTLSAREQIHGLGDPRILKAAQGADIFLDTAVRFMLGEEDKASANRAFAETLFNLLAAGARTVTGAHHSPKAFRNKTEITITLENALRGSGDIGAMLSTAWAVVQVDEKTNRIYVQNVKPRDFEPCGPFEIEGRPHIDETGNFKMVSPPGTAKAPTKGERKRPTKNSARRSSGSPGTCGRRIEPTSKSLQHLALM